MIARGDVRVGLGREVWDWEICEDCSKQKSCSMIVKKTKKVKTIFANELGEKIPTAQTTKQKYLNYTKGFKNKQLFSSFNHGGIIVVKKFIRRKHIKLNIYQERFVNLAKNCRKKL